MKHYKLGLLWMATILCLFVLVGCSSVELPQQDPIENENIIDEKTNDIPLLLMDEGISQETRLSQIKADLLKKNNGYLDSDSITAIIELPGDSLMDVYLNENPNYASLHEFAGSYEGEQYTAKLSEQQNNFITKLMKNGYIDRVEHQYTTVMNAVSVKTTYGNFKRIEAFSSISRASISETYNLPKTVSNQESAVHNIVDIYETGIFNSSSVSFNGEGTAVAILDSGFDITHTVFREEPTKTVVNEDSIASVLSQLEASKSSSNLLVTDVYKTKKVPFAYDYADRDTEVDPSTSNHGTHVAGIIGGHDDVVTGVATHTQLVLLKVFSDEYENAETDDIVAALEDAVLLGVDAINMSLGTSCGFSRGADADGVNEIYDKINQSGISLITAASNSYSSAYGGENGNTNKVTNPDSATVGAPSTYPAALSVASISGTLSNYIIDPDGQAFFFNESNSINGKQNNFIKELGISGEEDVEIDYVTVPGVGLRVNYSNIDVKGKIALVRRGDNTFEEKASIAKENGAIACIIYNNVAGEILMSMGKSDHIPTMSVSKDVGEKLAKHKTGKLTFNATYQAGPFISNFSSWGPNPDLKLKPEITAHGGNITSSVPGGGYDQLSGTSMASPNMCGVVVLIRQYLKEKYASENYTAKQITDLAYQLLMSTATIALNEEGNPYSPRKQGAGLASLKDATTTPAYITVDHESKTKLELGDDPKRTGVYTMEFNVNNISDLAIQYHVDVLAMTESVSTSDKDYVAEKAYMLSGSKTVRVNGSEVADDQIIVPAHDTLKVSVTYTLSNEDKAYIEKSFAYGMYVEGFVVLNPVEETSTTIDLNIPFLAFYGDWTEAPLFDKTFYEVESEAHDGSIDDEDKLKADYYATTPFGSYFSNYIISLGTYIYTIDESVYTPIPATEEHIAISNAQGTIDGIGAVYAGLLRNAKTITYSIVDRLTGEVVYSLVDENCTKAYFGGAAVMPYFNYLRLKTTDLNLVNNRQYDFKMEAKLDYGDGGVASNVRNTFEFSFYMDEEAPLILNATYDKTYDKTLKKDRYYINLEVYDNHYVQSISPIAFSSPSSYSLLAPNPIPVYSEKGETTKIRFEITDYLDELYSDGLITSALAFSIDDYALNTNLYVCQLPGTKGDFKFTEDGTMASSEKTLIQATAGEVVDLVPYLATSDTTVDENKDFLKHLVWTSSNENVAVVREGQVLALAAGRARITVSEAMYGRSATITIRVLEDSTISLASVNSNTENLKKIRFSYFDTVYAHLDCGTNSKIGKTGERRYLTYMPSDASGTPIVEMYPGEQIKLAHVIEPWYLPEDRYELRYSSTNPNTAKVDENGVVTALKKGSCTIRLNILVDGKQSNMLAAVKISVQSEFVIESNTLVAYKGLGGDVVIPDDEGILNIGAHAFCLYEIDKTIPIDDRHYDANRVPGTNQTITSVTIPEGVEDIQKYAFYKCEALTKVVLPESIKFIREFAFYGASKLENINMENVEVICSNAFTNCSSLNNIQLTSVYSIALEGFAGCSSLTSVDVSALRNSGKDVFRDCTQLKTVTFSDDTKLSEGMFKNTAIERIEFGVRRIPQECFANCTKLSEVIAKRDLIDVGKEAFAGCTSLERVALNGSVRYIYDQAFAGCTLLNQIILPNGSFTMGNQVFLDCVALESLTFLEQTLFTEIGSGVLAGSSITRFDTTASAHYTSTDGLLLNKEGDAILLAAPGVEWNEWTLPANIQAIEEGAFAGIISLTKLTLSEPTILLGNHAFAGCTGLTELVLPTTKGLKLPKEAFLDCVNLVTISNLDQVAVVGERALSATGIRELILGDNTIVEKGAFMGSDLRTITLGKQILLHDQAFQNCRRLTTVLFTEGGSVEIGASAFENDNQLAVIDLSKAQGTIGSRAFYGTAITSAQLDQIEVIGDYAFADCNKLEQVTMPIVTKIGDYAFAKYSENGQAPKISEIVLPDTLHSLGAYAFSNCNLLTTITIPTCINRIEAHTFDSCAALTSVVLPETVTSIEEGAFSNCKALASINLNKVQTIGDNAFISCAALTGVDLAVVQEIGYGAFAMSGITSIGSAEELRTIGDYAFQSTGLKSVFLPSLEVLKDGAFSNCATLEDFTFTEHIKEIGKVVFYRSPKLTHLYAYLNGNKEESGKLNEYAQIQNNVLYAHNQNGNLVLAAVPAALQADQLVVENGTVLVEPYAGNENRIIQSIVFPDSLKSIGNFSFYGYTNLKEVEFRSYVAPTLESFYVEGVSLDYTDPGYAILHHFYDLIGYYPHYLNFIDLVGKRNPITMILPSNEDVQGYDNIIYEVYFGKVEQAKRSEYITKDTTTTAFLEMIGNVKDAVDITLSDEAFLLDILTVRNALKQDLTNFGYTQAEVDEMFARIEAADLKIKSLKLQQSSEALKQLQKDIDGLTTTFTISLLDTLKGISNRINACTREEKNILDLRNYNALVASYNTYISGIHAETTPIEEVLDHAFAYKLLAVLVTTTTATMALVAFLSKNKWL